MWKCWTCVAFCYIAYGLASAAENSTTSQKDAPTQGFQLVTLQWDHVKTPYVIAAWLLLASGAKILFNLMGPITHVCPESALLIVVGLAVGGLLKLLQIDVELYTLTHHVFFIYLLPPIIFDAGYFMPNRALFENLDSVMLFAVVGTIFNTAAIGLSLWYLQPYNYFSIQFDILDIFLFAALISAVDPVAVIAVFEEIHVNEFLFVNVFGEALFNDGVTVVLYNLFKSYKIEGQENLTERDYVAGGCSFFIVALGGTFIGIVFAFMCSFLTKFTEHMNVLSTVFVFLIPYMAYLTAEWFSVSSIIAIAVCGMVMKQYVKGNISPAANSSVKYFVKMLAQSSETVIFLFLGLSSMQKHFQWDTYFVCATIVFCLVWRTVGVIVQCFFLNKVRGKKFSMVDQFVLSYGGLRGAIAYGLAVSIPDNLVPAKNVFVTTTIAVIYFTVFLQGITIRPLVNWLDVKKADQSTPTMTESVYNKYLDYMMSGLEDIIGIKGHYTIRDNFERLNAKILRPIFMRNEKKKNFDASKIVRAYAKITLEEAMNMSHMIQKKYPEKTKLEKIEEEPKSPTTFNKYDFNNAPASTSRISPSDEIAANLPNANMESLYTMFSELLDRKLKELQREGTPIVQPSDNPADDIEDDYMRQLNHEHDTPRSPPTEFDASTTSFRSLRNPSSEFRHRRNNVI